MPHFGVRTFPLVLAVACLTACGDAPSTPLTTPTSAIDRAVNSAPLVNATIHEIPALLNLTVNGMNDSDEISGDSGSGHPFKWSPAHGIQWLSTTGLQSAAATGISNNGGVAGYGAAGDSNAFHGVVWLPNGTPRVFPLPPDSLPTSPEFSEPSCGIAAINVYGQLVGNCAIKDGFSDAESFQWHGPTTTPLGVPQSNQVTSISDDGWIGGGNMGDMFGSEGAFIVSPTGQYIVLKNHDGQPTVTPSWVNGITRHGWAAGTDFEDGCGQAVAWLDHTGQSYPEFRMGTCGGASALTNDWYVVGVGTDALNDPSSHWAFVWFPGPGLQRLPGFGKTGETSEAVAVNANHHVLGRITDGTTVHIVIWYVGPRPAAATTP